MYLLYDSDQPDDHVISCSNEAYFMLFETVILI
jgi:hypothetical protein